MCASSTVENPRVKRNATKSSIREIPITISALSIGMLVTPIIKVRIFGFIAWIPREAAVPIKVAISAESNAMIRVV